MVTKEKCHNHHGLNWVKKEGSDSGFGGQAWVSLKMTNNLPVGIYTVVFELFSGISGISGSVTQLKNETLLQQVHGDADYKIITFSHDYQTTHSKAFIQFTSNGQAGEITFQIRYYGSSYNNSTLNFLFFSRVLAGRVGTAFNHALFDVDDVQLKNQILYFEDVNLNENKIKGLAAPSEDKDGANKKYVDDEIKAIPAVDTSDLLKLDGSRSVTGNLQMRDHTITGIRSSSQDNAALTVGASRSLYLPIPGIRGMQGNLNMGGQSIVNLRPLLKLTAQPAQDNEAINFGYFHTQRGYLKRLINEVAYDALNRKNPEPMQDPIDMGNNFITDVKDHLPSNSHYAVTVNFVNKTVSDNNATISALIDSKINEVEDLNIKSAKQENVFSFIMDDDLFKEDDSDITKVGKVNKDFYDIHKETYQFIISYDGNIGYYSTRLGIDLKPLDLGEYTFVFEMYYDKNKVNKELVVVEAQSVPLNISKNTTKTFDNHSRTIINFNKPGNLNIIYLDIDITIKYHSGYSYDNLIPIFVVVYGVSGHQNDVESRVWNRVYLIQNNAVLFEATIDMNNKQIKNLADGAEDGDAVNVSQLINMTTTANTEIDKIKTDVTNNHTLFLALYNYIIRNELKDHIIKDLYFSDSREIKTANTYLFNFPVHLDPTNRNNFTFYYVFKHNTGTNNVMTIAIHWGKDGNNSEFHFYIHVSKSQIKISINPLINESHLSLINIPNKALGKQILFWIWVQGTTFRSLNIDGTVTFINLKNYSLQNDFRFGSINVDDTPFTKIRGFITSNVYDDNSEAYGRVREFERAQGTII